MQYLSLYLICCIIHTSSDTEWDETRLLLVQTHIRRPSIMMASSSTPMIESCWPHQASHRRTYRTSCRANLLVTSHGRRPYDTIYRVQGMYSLYFRTLLLCKETKCTLMLLSVLLLVWYRTGMYDM